MGQGQGVNPAAMEPTAEDLEWARALVTQGLAAPADLATQRHEVRATVASTLAAAVENIAGAAAFGNWDSVAREIRGARALDAVRATLAGDTPLREIMGHVVAARVS